MQNNYQQGAQWNTSGGPQANDLSSTDLTVVQDEMYSEALAYKKCRVYADRFGDPTLKSMAGAHAEHHRQHFDALQNYLESRR